jgi:hypothetical protein
VTAKNRSKPSAEPPLTPMNLAVQAVLRTTPEERVRIMIAAEVLKPGQAAWAIEVLAKQDQKAES